MPPHSSAHAPIPVDLLIEARWIIPVEPAGVVLEEHALVVQEGRIEALLEASLARARYAPRERLELPQHVLLPGFINLHCHAAMSLLRGFADDLPLHAWLQQRIWPAEAQFLSPEFVFDGVLLAAAEMLSGGVTCCNDMYFFPAMALEAAQTAGLRYIAGITVLDAPSVHARNAEECIHQGLTLRDQWRDEPLTGFCLAPHAPYTVSDAAFERIGMLAAQLDLPIHLHLHETAEEIQHSLQHYGVRPVERLRRLGLLDPRLIAVHAVHLLADEIELLASCGSTVAHCPSSNLKLASGIAPLAAMQRAGLRVGIGTDGAASNNRLDLLHEMRLAALLAKGSSGDATVLPAHQVLHMATLAGATGLGLEEQIGSLRPGKRADLCALSLADWRLAPCFDVAAQIVHVAGREHVSHVWTDGRLRYCDGRHMHIDLAALQDRTSLWHDRVSRFRQ